MTVKKTSLREKLLSKKATTRSIPIMLNGEQVEITAQALPESVLRDLKASYPMTKKQKDEGFSYNPETFPPHFLAESVTEPVLTAEEWESIWTSKDWSLGELRDLFDAVFSLTVAGFDLPFGGKA